MAICIEIEPDAEMQKNLAHSTSLRLPKTSIGIKRHRSALLSHNLSFDRGGDLLSCSRRPCDGRLFHVRPTCSRPVRRTQ